MKISKKKQYNPTYEQLGGLHFHSPTMYDGAMIYINITYAMMARTTFHEDTNERMYSHTHLIFLSRNHLQSHMYPYHTINAWIYIRAKRSTFLKSLKKLPKFLQI